jgi:SAM-dependent methyltransferase
VSAVRSGGPPTRTVLRDAGDAWLAPIDGRCSVCGSEGVFAPDEDVLALRRLVPASFVCGSCGATLKYQGQADVLLRRYASAGARSVAELVAEPAFGALAVYEPGRLGPFRRFLGVLPGYVRSQFVPGARGGAVVDGVRCEDLMALSFASGSLDLVVTTDVFEHVRLPYVAFAEVFRTLRSGGMHVFTVPCVHPLRDETIERVDVRGTDDVFLMEPVYHHGTELVYNEFGADLVARLADIGFETDVERFDLPGHAASEQLTFCSSKP